MARQIRKDSSSPTSDDDASPLRGDVPRMEDALERLMRQDEFLNAIPLDQKTGLTTSFRNGLWTVRRRAFRRMLDMLTRWI